MSINVVCLNCGKRFKVADKFSGKTGPCPNCKHTIKIPPRDNANALQATQQLDAVNGQPTNQAFIKATSFNATAITIYASVAFLILAMTFFGGAAGFFKNSPIFTALTLMLVSPILAAAGYRLLYNENLEPYKGIALTTRAAICGLCYTLFWGVYVYLEHGVLTGELWNWVFVAPVFFGVGTLTASYSLDLEYSDAFFHYFFYMLTTIILRWAAGLNWIWDTKNFQ